MTRKDEKNYKQKNCSLGSHRLQFTSSVFNRRLYPTITTEHYFRQVSDLQPTTLITKPAHIQKKSGAPLMYSNRHNYITKTHSMCSMKVLSCTTKSNSLQDHYLVGHHTRDKYILMETCQSYTLYLGSRATLN